MAKYLVRLNYLVFGLMVTINLLGVFMPELGFDALWYHLTLSKLFLPKGQWYFPGGLFYYSAMPRLGELIGLPFLAAFGYIGPKFVQFVAGLICCTLIYRLTKRLLHSNIYDLQSTKLLSLTAVNLFYATWLVSWQSSSAYVDLVRTALELSALYILTKIPARNASHSDAGGSNTCTEYSRSIKSKIAAGFFLGLAIGVKWLSFGSLILMALIFSPLVVPVALLVASPWFLIAYRFTDNPVYPLFEKFMTQTQLAQVEPHYLSLISFVKRLFLAPFFLTKPTEDFLSPVTGLIYLSAFLGLVSGNKIIRRISIYGILGTFLLLLTPPPSTRYFLPYFPALIISSIYIISKLKNWISDWLVLVLALSAFLVFSLRSVAFAKYLPYLTGKKTLNQFLASQSYRLPDTFIDEDDFVKNNLPKKGRYLISNLHNLYYFPYDFDHESFADDTRSYDYLITKGASETKTGKLIHQNSLGIQIFKL